jgi:hypothetical protein
VGAKAVILKSETYNFQLGQIFPRRLLLVNQKMTRAQARRQCFETIAGKNRIFTPLPRWG